MDDGRQRQGCCCACGPPVVAWHGEGETRRGGCRCACRCERCQLLAHTSVGPVVVAAAPKASHTGLFLFQSSGEPHRPFFFFQSSGEPCPTENLASSWVGTSCRVACALIPPPKRPPAYSRSTCCCSLAVLNCSFSPAAVGAHPAKASVPRPKVR